MITIGWFAPISERTGIAKYSKQILSAMKRRADKEEIRVIVFYPPTEEIKVDVPFPKIELTPSLIESDFAALFDVAIYHFGNNAINHKPIFEAALKHPGIGVLHDHVYQHYFAGEDLKDGYIGGNFISLIESLHPGSIDTLISSGVMRAHQGKVNFVPWESEWSTIANMSNVLAATSLGVLVHSAFSKSEFSEEISETTPICDLFLPRPDREAPSIRTYNSNDILDIVFCGHIGPTKSLDLLISAISNDATLRNSVRVTIAGFASDSVYIGNLKANVEKRDLDKNFKIIQNPDEDQYFQIMESAHVFYNLRYPNTEGASLSLIEQMTLARPSLVYDSGVFSEIPKDACYVVDGIDDPEELARSVKTILLDSKGLRARSQKSRKYVERRTAEQYADKLISFIYSNIENFTLRASNHNSIGQLCVGIENDERSKMESCFNAYHLTLSKFYKKSLHFPNNFADFSSSQKAKFLVFVILEASADGESLDNIGAQLDVYELNEIILLFCLLKEAFLQETNYAVIIPKIFNQLPANTSLSVWKIVELLPSSRAGLIALRLLRLRHRNKILPYFIDAIDQVGFRKALYHTIKNHDEDLYAMLEGTPFYRFIENKFQRSNTSQVGVNVIDVLRTRGMDEALVFGFHKIEPVGIWSAVESAEIILSREVSESSESGFCGSLSTLVLPNGDTPKVSIKIYSYEEEGETEFDKLVTEVDLELRVEDAVARADWSVSLLELGVSNRIVFSVDKLVVPLDIGISEDGRALGVLIESLFVI